LAFVQWLRRGFLDAGAFPVLAGSAFEAAFRHAQCFRYQKPSQLAPRACQANPPTQRYVRSVLRKRCDYQGLERTQRGRNAFCEALK
jgi:hypothetical protein